MNVPYFVMFFEYLPESCKVESLVVLQQYQTEVELRERQLDVVQLPCIHCTSLVTTLNTRTMAHLPHLGKKTNWF